MKKLIARLRQTLRTKPKATLAFRACLPADVDWIVRAIVTEAARGHFNADYGIEAAAKGLRHQMACLIADVPVPWPGHRNGAGGRALGIQVNGHDVGFVLLLEDAPGSWSERVELFALVIDDAARGSGIATQAVRQLIEGVQSRGVYARCYATSPTMRRILERSGFSVVATSIKGTVTLELTASSTSVP
jgi:GNAT superfamily N-acetyltransferase